ncbi:MAG TPA: HipA family kinase, partial [Flavisolibacter sp.]
MKEHSPIRTVTVTRYVTPLREGGSLPAIVEADDDFLYVLKFRGAGQGIKALVAELLGGEIARALGFKIPEIVFSEVDPAFGRTEPDEEIQDLLKASAGLNLALHYLSGSIAFDP